MRCALQKKKNKANKAGELTKETSLMKLCCFAFERILNANNIKVQMKFIKFVYITVE